MVLTQTILVLELALMHLVAGKLRFLDAIPRSRWLSLAGGISVAYVFIHLFPTLEESQRQIRESWPILSVIEYRAYLVALCGLAIFYGLERMVKSSKLRREKSEHDEETTTTGLGVLWLHIFSFAIYNALISYLLVHREEQDARSLLFLFIAMTFHFLVNDYGLRHDHKTTYKRIGRWVLAASILIGWLVGLLTRVSEGFIGVLVAVLAGAFVLNVLKEELPEERQSRFSAFTLGAIAYSVLLLL